jgi:hypothetical protein
MDDIFIDKIVCYNNKRLINKFINQQEETKIIFENFVEYMFRKSGKDIITCVGIECPSFEKLKKMNVMIPEIYEKMWAQMLRGGEWVLF